MTIIAGFSSSRQGSAPLNLAAQVSRNTGEKIIAAVIIEQSLAPSVAADLVDDEYLGYVTADARNSLEQVVDRMHGDLDITVTVHHSTSIPRGLMELADMHAAGLAVVGSSSSGLLGRVALGSVTERLVHTARVPVAIAPRGYPLSPTPIERLTMAYGGAADAVGLVAASAELAKRWSVRLRIASFTARPSTPFGGAFERSAENLVVREWARKTRRAVTQQLEEARDRIELPNVNVVVGAGTEWRDAVDSVAWQPGDMLLLGSGAAGPVAQVFLGSVASKILRHAPVPVMIMPRFQQ